MSELFLNSISPRHSVSAVKIPASQTNFYEDNHFHSPILLWYAGGFYTGDPDHDLQYPSWGRHEGEN